MNKKRLFASTRNNSSAKSGLARVSGAFVVLIGIVLLVMSGCAGDVRIPVPVPVPVPAEPGSEDPLNPPDSYSPAPGLTVAVEISTGTVMQGGDVTLSATVTNEGPGRSREYALLVFYRSEDAVINPDLHGSDVVLSMRSSAKLAISDAMHNGLGLDPVLYTNFIKRSLVADQNVREAVDERVKQNVQAGVVGIVLDPVIDTKLVGQLAVNQVSKAQAITIPSTADAGTFYYGACVILVGFSCASAELVVTVAPVPDLVPASPAVPVFNKLAYNANEMVTVDIKVRNGGGADSTDGVARLYREAGDTDVPIGDPIALGTIAAGATADFSTIFVTENLFGVHQQEYYFAIGTVSNEANSSNNNSGPGLIVVSRENLIDVDGDRLIDVYTLDMLYNIRYNLAGTSYKTSAADTGNRCGARGDIDCAGYELMRDLDFTKPSSYENNNGKLEWLPNNHNPAQATNAGWEPIGMPGAFDGVWRIGKPERTFSAIFEGNSYRISNLYSRGVYDSGLFDVVTGTVRNLTVVNGNVHGGSDHNKVGVLAGTVYDGMVMNCAARGGSAHGSGGGDFVGGLVGMATDTIIAASYSTASVYADAGGRWIAEAIGGLVGKSNGTTIVASYSTGTVHGGLSSASKLGGLLGSGQYSITGGAGAAPSIIASYSIGNIYGGGIGYDWIGGLAADFNAYSGINNIDIDEHTAACPGYGHFHGNNIRASFTNIPTVTASYATGNSTSNGLIWDDTSRFLDMVAAFVVNDSYGFGTTSPRHKSHANEGVPGNPLRQGSPWPNGVTRVSDLTANNAGATWNSAASLTAGAWAFDASYSAPALKYAEYDGDGGVDYCAHFPAGACSGNRLLPNQPVVDQGGSIQSAYVIETQLYPGVGVSIPAKITTGDSDYFQITVEQPGLLNIESDSGMNTQATLYASNGTALEYDDNDGAGNNFKISRAVSRGVFYIRAFGYSNQADSYTLNVNLTGI